MSSCSSPVSWFPEGDWDLDWDQPFTDEDLQRIDEIVSSATASKKRPLIDSESRNHRRRLPPSLSCPNYKSHGRTVYSRTAEEVDRAALQLLKFVERKRKEVGQAILGFDIEWRPSFRRGISPGRVAVMQICCDTSLCYVMHIFHSGIPHSLHLLLEDPASTKVGVGIGNDSVKLFKDHNVSTKDVQDLSKLANQKLGGELKMWSLRSLIEELFHKQLEKPCEVQLGNWEAKYLSNPQLKYAALDAYASWCLHQALDCLPDAPDYDNAEN
uniref:3'-5' exonuclease n=1 Tax=Kalanchoe fedtschenkoi TaxID=63787 RepID=A0A7N0UT10_KALFE